MNVGAPLVGAHVEGTHEGCPYVARWAGAGRSRDSGQDARATQVIVTLF
jgi:hypothetical protein